MAREARQSGKRPAFFEDLPTPSRAPKSAKVYIEKHNTPNGSCVVELNAYDKMNAQQERLRDPNAPLIGTLGRGKRKASPTMNAKEREQAKNVEQRGRIDAQRRLDGKMEGAQPKQPKQYACRFRRRPGESEPNHFDRVMGEFGEVAERQNRLRERDLDLNDTARREDHSTAPNRCWPPPRPRNESGTTNFLRHRDRNRGGRPRDRGGIGLLANLNAPFTDGLCRPFVQHPGRRLGKCSALGYECQRAIFSHLYSN